MIKYIFIASNFALYITIPKNPLVDTIFRNQGWLNAWYGFDILSLHSNAFRRITLILGLIGLVNLVVGIALTFRNKLVGWMTITPLLTLLFPALSLPFANYLAEVSPNAILAFHRVIFEIPSCLALISICAIPINFRIITNFIPPSVKTEFLKRLPPFSIFPAYCLKYSIPFVCLLLTALPARYPYCNRIWNILSVTPADLVMKPVLTDFYKNINPQVYYSIKNTLVIASSGVSVALQSYAPIETLFNSQERLLHGPPRRSPSLDFARIDQIGQSIYQYRQPILYWPKYTNLITPQSHAGYLSQHWNPTEVALAYTFK